MIYISQLLDTPKLVELVKEYDVGIEIISFSIGYVLDDLKYYLESYKKEFSVFEGNVTLTFHGPFLDMQPGSCDKKVIKLARERFEAAYEAAKAFGVNQMIFHTGYTPNTYPKEYWLENVINFWEDFLQDKIEECSFYIENVLDEDWEIQKKVVEAINHPNFKACLDIGHVAAYSKASVQKWICALGDKIGYVHLHNNDGSKDSHSGFLEGSLPIKLILEELRKQSPNAHWCLEIGEETALKASLEWLRHNGFKGKSSIY